ncbi:type II toxin-antitoxin system RelE/ParE family toxin [Lactiplantibacillus pentosus]|uniref:type II toxin-antitoxin system RelE/ParE family toxin n=1 Tax=Lactiplantibacillus pentosus TaxID=1589 RepID=UPI003F52C994
MRTFGASVARRIGARIDEIAATKTLTDVSRFPPPRLHMLNGDHTGLFAVDVSANYRLLFAGFDKQQPQTLDSSEVVAVVFVDIEDYH